jgi:hypothetical protein
MKKNVAGMSGVYEDLAWQTRRRFICDGMPGLPAIARLIETRPLYLLG